MADEACTACDGTIRTHRRYIDDVLRDVPNQHCCRAMARRRWHERYKAKYGRSYYSDYGRGRRAREREANQQRRSEA